MANKVNEILDLVVCGAQMVVKLSEIWKKIGPDVKNAVKPFLDGCSKIASLSNSNGKSPKLIDNKK